MNEEPKELLAKFEPKEVNRLELDRQVHSARFSPCGDFLFAGGLEGEVRHWHLGIEGVPQLDPLEGHGGWVQPIVCHPHEKLIFSADSWGQIRASTYGDYTSTTRWAVEDAHDGWVRDLSISSDGKFLASCGRDSKVRIWSTTDGKQQHQFDGHEHDVYCVKFHPNGKSVVSGDERANVLVWDLEKREQARELDASTLYLLHRLQDVGGARVLAFDADGKTLAVGGTNPKNGGNVQGVPTVLLFDFESGQLKHTLELGQTSNVYVHGIHFHEAGFLICVTSGSPGTGQLLFRRPEDKEPFFISTKMANCHSLSMHPDGQHFAVLATNRGSNGNGRRLDKNGEYIGNNSPIHIFEFPSQESANEES